jgi:hypothetical protein
MIEIQILVLSEACNSWFLAKFVLLNATSVNISTPTMDDFVPANSEE